MVSTVSIINVYDGVNATTYTFGTYYKDAEFASDMAARLAQYWAREHGGVYKGFVQAEEGIVVEKDSEPAMIYYVQTLVSHEDESIVDSI